MLDLYAIVITVGLVAAYFGIAFLLSFFFTGKRPIFTRNSLVSVGIIGILSAAGYVVAFTISDPEVGNRILHGFGGGFMALLVCFFVIKDTRLQINKFQFFVISFLLVTSLGVANEILEFFLEQHLHLVFVPHIYDTWFDLMSNTVGVITGLLVCTPFVRVSDIDTVDRAPIA
jgi:ABC-type Fe3+-siderophore transport system permease subunit